MKRRGIPFTPDDDRVIEALKVELRPIHGDLTLAAIVRLGIRSLLARRGQSGIIAYAASRQDLKPDLTHEPVEGA